MAAASPALINPFAQQARKGKRTLPTVKDRVLVTVLIAKSLDLKLEVFCALEGRAKNAVVVEALGRFFSECLPCDVARARVLPASQKKRVTLILSKDVEACLNRRSNEKDTKTSIINAAMILYMEDHGVDTSVDGSPYIRWALGSMQEPPPRVPDLWH